MSNFELPNLWRDMSSHWNPCQKDKQDFRLAQCQQKDGGKDQKGTGRIKIETPTGTRHAVVVLFEDQLPGEQMTCCLTQGLA